MPYFNTPSEYLKQLKIQKYYVNKFRVNYANSNILTPILLQYIKLLNEEIERTESFINRKKEEFKKKQVTIFEFNV